MPNFSVIVKPESLSQTAQGAIVGTVFIKMGSLSFPDSKWSDFIIVLAHWLSAALKMQNRNTTSARFGFMEGPYEVLMNRSESGGWELIPKDRITGQEDVRIQVRTELEIIEALQSAARSVLLSCTNRSILSSDLDEIRCALAHFQS